MQCDKCDTNIATDIMAKNKGIANPFLYQGYVSPEYFCDREEETRTLKNHLCNGRNVTLISPRRIGKTGLIKNTFYHLQAEQKDVVCLYVDIFATRCLHDFVELLGTVVIEELVKKNRSLMDKILIFFAALRPVFSIDPLTGEPSVSLTVEPSGEDVTLRSIFRYLNESEQEVYLAIDEFQQIATYPETGTEALLRSYIQFTPHVHFIFSGSRHHIMAEMFGSPKHPFYQSTETMSLQPLRPEVYYPFCRRFFQQQGGDLSEKVFQEVYNRFEGHTWYVQCVMNRLYENEIEVTDDSQVRKALYAIISGRTAEYESLVQFLTGNQFQLLKAIAKQGIVSQPTSSGFIKNNQLSGASSVKAALKVLEDKELVYHSSQGFSVYNRFLELWLQRQP